MYQYCSYFNQYKPTPNRYYNYMINLIDQKGQINSQLQTYPKSQLTLAIFGTQGTGKSTFLNEVFQTSFPVLDTTKMRQRCTNGVWLSNINEINIIDTEGFDSYQRTQEQKLFEKQMGLFCVAISDIIVINMFMNEIGRYSGGHIDIIEAIFRVGEKLVIPSHKKIIFVIKDLAQDADKIILKQQLGRQMKNIDNKYPNKLLKFSIQYFFMSHYVYHYTSFKKEAQQFTTLINIKKPSVLNNYENDARVLYINELWKKIKYENEIDLKSLDQALQNFVFQRIKKQCLGILDQQMIKYNNSFDVKSYERYLQALKKISQDHFMENRPKHIKQSQVETHNNKFFQFFEPEAIKHFNQVIIKNIEAQLSNLLSVQIEQNKNNKALSHRIIKKRKQIIQSYKKMMQNHKEYSLLLKNFNERLSQIISKEQRKINHLFNLFEMYAEKELIKQIDKQIPSFLFNGEKLNKRIKEICLEYQYNEWEINFKDIWDRITNRVIEKSMPIEIVKKSEESIKDIGIFSGDQTTNIIAFHTKMQMQIAGFCKQILQFLHEETIFSQPMIKIKELVRQQLKRRMSDQIRRFKISLVLISFVLLFLYGEVQALLALTIQKKKSRKFYLRIFWYGSLILFIFALFKEAIVKKFSKPEVIDKEK